MPRKQRTLEHVLPDSRGGGISLGNLLISGPVNVERSNLPFSEWVSLPKIAENIQNYLNKYRRLKINGRNYVEQLIPTLNRQAQGIVVFSGNKGSRLNTQV